MEMSISKPLESIALNDILECLDSTVHGARHREIWGIDLKEGDPEIVKAVIRKVRYAFIKQDVINVNTESLIVPEPQFFTTFTSGS